MAGYVQPLPFKPLEGQEDTGYEDECLSLVSMSPASSTKGAACEVPKKWQFKFFRNDDKTVSAFEVLPVAVISSAQNKAQPLFAMHMFVLKLFLF